MKKLFFLFVMPLALFSETIKVTDLVGDWYGSYFGTSCDQVLCTFDEVRQDIVSTKVSISVKEATLEVVSNAKSLASDFYETNPVINIFFVDTLRLPIVNGNVEWLGANVYKGTFGISKLDGPGITFTRNAKNYLNLLITTHHWPGGGIFSIVKDSSIFILMQPSGNSFSRIGDTLILDSGPDKFLYDSAAQVYRNVRNTEMIIYPVNSYTLKIETTYKGEFLSGIIGGRPWDPAFVNDWSTCAGTWQSTTRPEVFIKINSSNILTSYIVTNSIDGLHDVQFSPHHSQGMSSLINLDTLKTNVLTDGSTLYVNAPDATISTTTNPPSFYLSKILSIFSYDGLSMRNNFTGEQFSKVTGIEEFDVQTNISLKSNPVSNEAEIQGLNEFEYELLNAQGIMVKKGFSSDGKIPMATLTSGGYFIKINAQGKPYVFKVVKN